MYLKKFFYKFEYWVQPKYSVIFVNELPEEVLNKTIYIIGSKEYPWVLIFNCPCGCSSLIQLNLLKDEDPCWTYGITKEGKISIFPSIRRITGCKAHFLVRKSKIDFVKSFRSGKNSKLANSSLKKLMNCVLFVIELYNMTLSENFFSSSNRKRKQNLLQKI